MAKDDKKSYKGKYAGPEIFKGNKKLLERWRKEGKPKAGSSKFKKEFPKYGKLIAAKNKSDKSDGDKSGDKMTALEKEARDVAHGQYAGAISTINDSRRFNQESYDTQTARRQKDLTKELASQSTAHQITRNTVSGLKGEALAQYVKDQETKKAVTAAREAATAATNSNALSSYQHQMLQRGLDPTQVGAMKANMEREQGYSSILDEIAMNASVSGKQNANMMYDRSLSRVDQQQNSAAANARASAQNDLNSAYDQYTSRQHELNSQLSSTKLDRDASETDIWMTLKKEKQLAQQEQAQLELERYVAGLNNDRQMAEFEADNYFKEAELNLKRSDLELEGDKLDALIADKKRKNELKEAELLEKRRDNLRKNATADAKAGIKSSYASGRISNYDPTKPHFDQ